MAVKITICFAHTINCEAFDPEDGALDPYEQARKSPQSVRGFEICFRDPNSNDSSFVTVKKENLIAGKWVSVQVPPGNHRKLHVELSCVALISDQPRSITRAIKEGTVKCTFYGLDYSRDTIVCADSADLVVLEVSPEIMKKK